MMTSIEVLAPKFVEFIPKKMEAGVLYISGEYATTAHKCACGCGNKVVLPLHPADWRMSFDGKAVTIRPSVGNWSFSCRSHYLITSNRIEWAGDWSDEQIVAGRVRDNSEKSNWYDRQPVDLTVQDSPEAEEANSGWFGQIVRFLKEYLNR